MNVTFNIINPDPHGPGKMNFKKQVQASVLKYFLIKK